TPAQVAPSLPDGSHWSRPVPPESVAPPEPGVSRWSRPATRASDTPSLAATRGSRRGTPAWVVPPAPGVPSLPDGSRWKRPAPEASGVPLPHVVWRWRRRARRAARATCMTAPPAPLRVALFAFAASSAFMLVHPRFVGERVPGGALVAADLTLYALVIAAIWSWSRRRGWS